MIVPGSIKMATGFKGDDNFPNEATLRITAKRGSRKLLTFGQQTNMKRKKIAVHALCLPWVALPVLWLLVGVPLQAVQDRAFVGLLVVHNMFLHEWPGRSVLALSVAAVLTGFFIRPLTPKWLACLLGYSLILGCLVAYTIWWGVTGQQYDWP
jgi:hypothetical protein